MIRARGGPALAAALVLLLALSACGEQKSSRTPEASPTPVTEAKPADVSIDVAKLSKGSAPKIGWMDGKSLHLGSKTIDLPFSEASEVAELGDRLVTMGGASDSGETEIQVRDSSGKITARYDNFVSQLVTNSERNIVAWIAEDNTPKVLQTGHREPLELRREAKGSHGDAIAVLGKDCFNGPETVEGAGCSVYFSLTRKGETLPFVASEHGFVDRADTKITGLMDVSPVGALVGVLDASAPKLCSRYESTEKSYEQCDFVPSDFSPDGDRLLGYSSEMVEGPTTAEIMVHDALTGKPVLTVRHPGIWASAWEDDDHVLAIVSEGEETTSWAVVRVGLEGEAELAAGPMESDSAPAYWFTVQP